MKHFTSKARTASLLGVSILAAALSSAAFAQSARSLTAGELSAGSGGAMANVSQKVARATEMDARVAAARDLVATFSGAATRDGLSEGWKVDLMQAVLSLPSASIRELKGAGTLRDAQKAARIVRSEMLAAARDGSSERAKTLGNPALDLVFTPITPCRVVDTRAGTKLAAGVTLNVDMDGGNPGNAAGCTHLGVGGPEVQGYAINITVTETGGGGFLQVQPFGVTPSTSWLNWTAANTTVANQGIVRNLDNAGTEYTIKGNGSDTHVLVDWFGYFGPPTTLSSLSCSVATGANVSLPAGSNGTNAAVAACTTGVRTGIFCATTNFNAVLAGYNSTVCNFTNPSATTFNVHADAICCSVVQ